MLQSTQGASALGVAATREVSDFGRNLIKLGVIKVVADTKDFKVFGRCSQTRSHKFRISRRVKVEGKSLAASSES